MKLNQVLLLLPMLALSIPAHASTLTITVENMSPTDGTWLTPVWVGIHDGSFDTFDMGAPASAAIEHLAEDGNGMDLMNALMSSGAGQAQTVIQSDMGIPPLAPGESGSIQLEIDGSLPSGRYLSYAAMVLPSNDAFMGNPDPMSLPIFDGSGNFLGLDMMWGGNTVKDAGTEVNDEIPAHTAFFGQATPDTGMDQGGVIAPHPGYMAAGNGGILDDPMFAAADFTQSAYPLLHITVTEEQTADINDIPVAFELGNAWPNPFNPTTTLNFSLAETAQIQLAVYNLAGQRVAVLQEGLTQRGEHQVVFNAANLASGVYIATLSGEGFRQSQKLVLLK